MLVYVELLLFVTFILIYLELYSVYVELLLFVTFILIYLELYSYFYILLGIASPYFFPLKR
jgi:hypothetical protein